MRLVLRFVSFMLLVAAVLAAGLDSIRSVARAAPDLAPLGKIWASISPQSFDWLAQAVSAAPQAERLQQALTWILLQPAFAVLGALSLFFWMIGWRKRPAAGRFAV